MSVEYKPVLWNRTKYIYDGVLIAGILVYLLIYIYVGGWFQQGALPLDDDVLRIRAFGSCAFFLLTIILCIGPLARLDRRFLPLLYNRRHFGVLTFTIGVVHASYVLGWYFAYSSVNPYVAVLGSNTDYGQILGFPFELFGVLALFIMMVLALTSHDFWLSFLSPPLWKALHMMIYVAYAALVLHIGLGALQSDASVFFTFMVVVSVFAVSGLHFFAARKEADIEKHGVTSDRADGYVVAGKVDDIAEKRALIVSLKGDERVAIFRYDGKLSALTNACAHQNGPLGEGKIMWGCVTCPWHGYQYRPEDGRAPAPFTEKIATYNIKLEGETILLDPNANPPGTPVPPVIIPVKGGMA